MRPDQPVHHVHQAEAESLEQLSQQLDRAALLAEQSHRSAFKEQARAGAILAKIKEKVGHGHFSEWLVRNFRFSEQTARKWMRLTHAAKEKSVDEMSADDLDRAGEVKTKLSFVLDSPKPPSGTRTSGKSADADANDVPENEPDEAVEPDPDEPPDVEPPVLDWAGYKARFGWLVRAMDDVARAGGLVDEDGAVVGDHQYQGLRRELEEWDGGFKRWFRGVTGERPPGL